MHLALALLLHACRPPGIAPPDTAPSDSAPTQDSAAVTAPPTEHIPSTVPEFSATRGLYDAPFDLEISSGICGATVRATVDGGDPRAGGEVGSPLTLAIVSTTVVRAVLLLDGEPLGFPVAHTYLFPALVPDQQAPAGAPSTWWTWSSAGGVPADYSMDPDIVEDPSYADMFPGVFSALPVVSIAMPLDDLFGAAGIYEHPTMEGEDWEREASLEWLPTGGGPGFSVGAGLRMTGGASRTPENAAKKSFRMLFREAYGAGELEQDLLGTDEATGEPTGAVRSFDTLELRARYNFSWIHWDSTQRSQALFLRDGFARALQAAMGQTAPHGRHVHLFIDGLYWGLYTLHERPDAHFQAACFGGDDEDWDVINTTEAIDGDRAAWEALLAQADGGDWEGVHAALDLEAFADYMLLNLFLGNTDWPWNNWYAARRRAEGEPFRFFVWDSEHILEQLDDDVTSVDYADSPGRLFTRLRRDHAFMEVFAARARQHLGEGGVLAPEALIARWEAMAAVVEGPVVAESARWGDQRRDGYPYSNGPYELYARDDHWRPEDARVREEILPERTATVWSQLVDAGLVPAE